LDYVWLEMSRKYALEVDLFRIFHTRSIHPAKAVVSLMFTQAASFAKEFRPEPRKLLALTIDAVHDAAHVKAMVPGNVLV